jgi:phosphoglycolate phosphatase-like HAD superfamily hydrolase
MNKRYLLIDLDGTLIDTATPEYDRMRSGETEIDLTKMRACGGAIDFLKRARGMGYEPIVISEAHPKYVERAYEVFFKKYCLTKLALADKPNTTKVVEFLYKNKVDLLPYNTIVVGDSPQDIELGRGLNVATVLVKFRKAIPARNRSDLRPDMGSGPTFYTRSFDALLEILGSPLESLLCLEAKFRGISSNKSIRLFTARDEAGVTAYRALARQNQGESDKYSIAEKYAEFCSEVRSSQLVAEIGEALFEYICSLRQYEEYPWDIVTYVPDDSTSIPANKMGELLDRLSDLLQSNSIPIACSKAIEWKSARGAIRSLHLSDEVNFEQKNVIVLDDRFTTGAIANAVCQQLRERGAKNVLFVALFHLTNPV